MRASADAVPRPGKTAPRLEAVRRRLRIARKIALIALALALGAPAQAVMLRLGPRVAQWLPVWFHRYALAVMGVRRDVRGASRGPALLVSNHVSWLDVMVIGACRPTAFVGKAEIALWPVFGALARLQDTLFVDRDRRLGAAADARDMARRLAIGQGIAVFAEGTSSDGCGVLPFRSALLGAVEGAPAIVQSVAVAYLARDGGRLDAAGRRDVAWWGDKELAPHLVAILGARSLDVRVEFGAPFEPAPGETRKTLARQLENEVRARVEAALA